MTTTTASDGTFERERDTTRAPGHPPPDTADERDFARVWQQPPGIIGWISAVQNGAIGTRFIVTAIVFFVLGGILSLLMRTQLAVPENDFLTPRTYNQLMTMHGSTMMYLFAIPLIEGIGALVLPQMLGGRELPYPRLSAFAYWTFLFGGIIFYASFLLGAVPDNGWYAYTPLSGPEFSRDKGMDFWLLGLNVAEIGAIAGAMELIISVLKIRAPGMSISRIPVFTWAMLVTGVMMIFAFTPLIVGSMLLEFDRKFDTHFYDPQAGGSPLLWQHLFWIFGHPDVYIQFLPAVGIVSTIVPVFARRALSGYTFVTLAIIATGFLSFGLWVHHMFPAGLPQASLTIFSAASMTIAIPAGVQFFAWISTIWGGRPVWKTPFLWVIGFMVIFLIGGLSGVMVAAVPFNWQATDSYFIVAHFHYVLIGGLVYTIVAGIYYWWPKFQGTMLSERLGKWHFWLFTIGFNVAFFPMHLSGFLGMPRRVYTYQAGMGLDLPNLISTIGAYLIALGVAVFLANVVRTVRQGEQAPNNPWRADTLEWATSTPMPQYGFRRLPIVSSRHPLWQQQSLEEGDERTVNLVRAFADWPREWRSQFAVSTFDGAPREIARVPGPSVWPFVLAASVTGISVAFIYDSALWAAVSAVVSVAALVMWHWPDAIERRGDTPETDAFEREHGIPVNIQGSAIVARWGMWMAILALAIGLATLVFSYFYLRLEVRQWPPDGVALPDLMLPGIGVAVLALTALPHWWAERALERGNIGRTRLGLALGLVVGAAGLALASYAFGQLDMRWDTNAYGSAVWALGIFAGLLAASGLIYNMIAQFWAWQGRYSARYRQQVANLALFWYFIVAATVAVYAVAYGAPYLI